MVTEEQIKKIFTNDDLQEIMGRHKAFHTFIKLLKSQQDDKDGAVTIPLDQQKSFSKQLGQLVAQDMPLLFALVRTLMDDNVEQVKRLQKVAECDAKSFDAVQTEILEYLSSLII